MTITRQDQGQGDRSPALIREVNLATPFSAPSAEEIREYVSAFQSLMSDLFLFCYERDFMTSLSDVKQAEIIEAFKSTSRYLDDYLNIDNPYFEGTVNRIYPPELQLNKANTSDTEALFFDLHLSISNGFVSSKFMISAMTLILI